MILAVYKDAGIWTHALLMVSLAWRRGRVASFPPAGFVGVACTSYRAIDLPQYRVVSIRMHRIRSIPTARLWRLTLELVMNPRLEPTPHSGAGSGSSGSDAVAGGVARSQPNGSNSITSISGFRLVSF